MIFKLAKVIPDGHTEWFTEPFMSKMGGAAAKVSAAFDSQGIEQGLDRLVAKRKDELAAAADPTSNTIYYMIGEPKGYLQGSSLPVTTYFKTRTR